MKALFILYVADQERSALFYRTLLQDEPVLDVPGMTEFELDGGSLLGLMPIGGARRLLGDANIADADPARARAEIYLVVEHPGQALDRAIEAGGRLLSPLRMRDWGDEAGYVMDPDGHVVAVAGQSADLSTA